MPWCQHRNSATGKPDVVHFQDGTGELIPGLRHGWKGSIPAPRTQKPYDKEVQEMVEALSGERLFQRAPGHYHPGFENFINKAHLRNPSRLHGTLVVHSCKLCCGRERHLLEDLEEGDDSDTEGKEENQEDDGTGRRRQRLRLLIIILPQWLTWWSDHIGPGCGIWTVHLYSLHLTMGS